MSSTLYAVTDGATGALDSGISAAALTFTFDDTDEANTFPQPTGGTCTSGGTSQTLNDTGIGAALSAGSVVVGDQIKNRSDGSVSTIITINTNDILTTPLRGGSDDTWSNNDTWVCNSFIATFTDGSTREQVEVIARATTVCTIETGTRGSFDTNAASWSTGDSIKCNVVKTNTLNEHKEIGELKNDLYDVSRYYGTVGGTADAITLTLDPPIGAYEAGQRFVFTATAANTGATTIAVDGLAAKTVLSYQNDALAANDILNGGTVEVIYDGTNLIMTSLPGNAPIQSTPDLEWTCTSGEAVSADEAVYIKAADSKFYSPQHSPISQVGSVVGLLKEASTGADESKVVYPFAPVIEGLSSLTAMANYFVGGNLIDYRAFAYDSDISAGGHKVDSTNDQGMQIFTTHALFSY